MNFFKNFLIAFLLSTIVFVPIAFFGTKYLIKNSFEKDKDSVVTNDSSSDPNNLGYTSNAQGIFSIMTVVTSPATPKTSPSGAGAVLIEKFATKPDIEIKFITLLRIDCNTKKAVITALPGDVSVKLMGEEMSITDAYYYFKTGKYDLPDNYIAELVKSLTGVSIDIYNFVDLSDYIKIADKLNGLNVKIEDAVTIIDQDSFHFYPVGENLLTTSDLKLLLNYEGYTTVNSKLRIIMSLCDAVLQKTLTTGTYINMRENWAKLNMDSEWSIKDFDSISAFLDELFSYRFCEVNMIGVKGGYVNVHGYKLYRVDLDNYISSLKL